MTTGNQMPTSALLGYHDRSKHRIDRYAPGPGELDWANQPDPFRSFAGAAVIKLPLIASKLPTRFNAIRRGELPAPFAFDVRSVAILFELSLGLSAWKSYGSTRWALRCNPSSGNLHPTEAYLLCSSLPGLSAGVYHYLSRDHVLEQRAELDDATWTSAFAGNGVIVGISSIHWREAWKYGMRGWRYCQHDCGHAIGALCYAAAALGWQARLLDAASDQLVATLLGLAREQDFGDAEREAPDCLVWIGNGSQLPPLERMREAALKARWSGRANRLSAEHVPWLDIDAIEHATERPATPAHPDPIPWRCRRPPRRHSICPLRPLLGSGAVRWTSTAARPSARNNSSRCWTRSSYASASRRGTHLLPAQWSTPRSWCIA